MTCHGKRARSGNLTLEGVPTGDPSTRPNVWEKVIKKLKAGEMPPAGAPRPDAKTLSAFADGLAADLDAAARRTPYAGRAVIHRLNRTEYANAVRDIFSIELPLTSELPRDGVAGGFDNIADALSMSPLLLERYLKVAQAVWQGKGMPFGTRGGIRVNHYFSHDGACASSTPA